MVEFGSFGQSGPRFGGLDTLDRPFWGTTDNVGPTLDFFGTLVSHFGVF